MNHYLKAAFGKSRKAGLLRNIHSIGWKGFSRKVCRRGFGRRERMGLPPRRSKIPGERKSDKTASCDQDRLGHSTPYRESVQLQRLAVTRRSEPAPVER